MKSSTTHIRILYLDSDLCICLINDGSANSDDNNNNNNWKPYSYEGSLAVYTKSEKCTGTKERVRRKVCFTSFFCAFAIYIYIYIIYIYIYIYMHMHIHRPRTLTLTQSCFFRRPLFLYYYYF